LVKGENLIVREIRRCGGREWGLGAMGNSPAPVGIKGNRENTELGSPHHPTGEYPFTFYLFPDTNEDKACLSKKDCFNSSLDGR